MAFENNQQEPGLPAGDKNYKRKTANHLQIFPTEFNNKFHSTLDSNDATGVAEKLNVFYGRKNVRIQITDNYVGDVTQDRENY